ncbi:ubiquinone biosynthesis protein COQ9 [Endobacter medicaginis]|uniref:COQ9 family protein n=1 Tax=Endobacter medicaginis TaxID=1181271 RepID=A0A839UYP1_9PROT|nr:COQ9 family protein [Endobacter medicaginis]MBB3173473.1 ubiquinone biosynthesis protein COQ9 [Endobacter medicaginis]MCX5475492.1 COQ9 family protein [Endobacter medicaginis]NVN30743.1 COQ9 family protein [Endobacter medicaginis]
MPPIERSAERDAAIEAVLPAIAFGGWTIANLREAAGADADLLFPGGTIDLVEAYVDYADRRMETAARALFAGRTAGLTQRIRALIGLRLDQAAGEREAIRRALAILALPLHARATARITARTVDSIWHAAGDTSADFSWYTKRAILAAVWSATLLFWLSDMSGGEATMEFLDRRLAGVARLGRLRARLTGRLRRVAPQVG